MKIVKTKKLVKKLMKELKKVKSYKEQMAGLTDDELKALTVSFKNRYESGESLDKILPETHKGDNYDSSSICYFRA